jgi:two-component system sensor histidine kinase RegB
LISSLTQLTQARLIHVRWLSVLAMFVAALISPNILGSGVLMPRLLAFATFIAAINACMQLALLFTRTSGEGLPMFSPLIQLTFDLASWGSYIYLSGGATNPLISVFLPLVAIGAIVLGKAQAWLFGIAAILSYTFLWLFYQPLAIADAQTATRLHLLGMWLVFVVSAIVVIWFILQMTKAIRERDVALAEAREQAIRNDWLVSMGSLAAGAAHELSTPLGTMNILIDDWLDDSRLSAEQRSDYQLMQSQIDTCKQALNQLTQRAGNPRSEGFGCVPAGTWLNTVLAGWSPSNPVACLVVQAEPELDQQAISVDITVERALANLLDNALGASATRITLEAQCQDNKLVICIEDDGVGISPETLQSFVDGRPVS